MDNQLNLKHYNKSELSDLLGYNEENIELLIDNYFHEAHKFIKKLREAVKSEDVDAYKHNANSIAEASKSVCFEVIYVMAIELDNCDIVEKTKVLDCIDDIENELEVVKDILNS